MVCAYTMYPACVCVILNFSFSWWLAKIGKDASPWPLFYIRIPLCALNKLSAWEGRRRRQEAVRRSPPSLHLTHRCDNLVSRLSLGQYFFSHAAATALLSLLQSFNDTYQLHPLRVVHNHRRDVTHYTHFSDPFGLFLTYTNSNSLSLLFMCLCAFRLTFPVGARGTMSESFSLKAIMSHCVTSLTIGIHLKMGFSSL